MDNQCPIIAVEEVQSVVNTSNENPNCDVKNAEPDSTIHAFDVSSNITVIERPLEITNLDSSINVKSTSCKGSDSGVELCCLQRASSINSTHSQEFSIVTPTCSYESSIISCCSNYEEAYNILARRNSTLLEDYKLRTCDGTSEGCGSESSSVAGSLSSKTSKRINATTTLKKKQLSDDTKSKNILPLSQRSRPTASHKSSSTRFRAKSTENSHLKLDNPKTPRNKVTPGNLPLSIPKKDSKTKPPSRGSSTTRTPVTTPTDDGRWPSINSKPAPLMGRSIRGLFTPDASAKRNNVNIDSKATALEKYATLPRRRKEKSVDNIHDLKNRQPTAKEKVSPLKRQSSRENQSTKTLPPYPRKKMFKTRIYHEIGSQTALTQTDIEMVFSGIPFNLTRPQDIETTENEVQVDRTTEEVEKLREQLKAMSENLRKEQLEKEALKEELKRNTDRVLAILGSDNSLSENENHSSDSLMVLETQYQKVSQIVIKQENEVSELNAHCRSLQRDLDKSRAVQKLLSDMQRDIELESAELQEFMQAEKCTLADALKEAEAEIRKLNLAVLQKDKEIENKQEEFKRLVKVSEQRRQENVGLLAHMGVFEARSRELLIYQSSHISGATVALASLICRLDGLVDELLTCYNISDQELEDVIFHNEAYTNSSSSPDMTPEKCKKIFKEKTPSPKRDSSFVSAIINAIKSATAQTPFANPKDFSKDTISLDNSDSTEMLDSETEPCLMMEPVLEDVVIPDGHSQNTISSGHGLPSSTRLTHSESWNNLSHQSIACQQPSEQLMSRISIADNLSSTLTSETSSLTELVGPPVPVVDQAIKVDNLVTRLLKVLRIIQIENDDNTNELQDERDQLSEQIQRQKEANKVVVQQLKDWEVLGAHLKGEITELMRQLSRKNNEIDDLKSELNQHRKEIERLNEDVCALSTACSKSELQLKIKHEETEEAIRQWEEKEEIPTKEVLAKIFSSQKEIPFLKEKLVEKEEQLNELKQEFLDSRQISSENWKEVVAESKKQYQAIDSTQDILRSIQTVVQQCPPLVKLQQDLEEVDFQNASSTSETNPSDCNANGALLKSINNLEILSPINSPA